MADMSPPLSHATHVFAALASETRCRIVARLLEGEQGVGILTGLLHLRQSALSNHLAVLREAGLVSTTRRGRSVCYRIGERSMPLIRALWDCFALARDPTLAADGWRVGGGS